MEATKQPVTEATQCVFDKPGDCPGCHHPLHPKRGYFEKQPGHASEFGPTYYYCRTPACSHSLGDGKP